MLATSGETQGGRRSTDPGAGRAASPLMSPVPLWIILIFSSLWNYFLSAFRFVLYLVVGALMGAQITSNPLGWLALVVLLTLFTLGFAGIALAFAARSSSIMGYHGLIFLFNLPLLFATQRGK